MQDLGNLDAPVIVFGGPYSNLQATQAMRTESDRLGIPPERVICNGDVVAYCGEPSETLELIRRWGIPVVMGNCEESLGQAADDCGCGFDEGTLCSTLSVEWYRFANALMTPDQRQWMRTLPRSIRFSLGGHDFTLVHGSPENISEFVFASHSATAEFSAMNGIESTVLIGGHSGLPFGQMVERTSGRAWWLNTGVIGMPANDGTRDGWYLLLSPLESGGVEASWHRLPYDSGAAMDAMHRAGLGPAYREALGSGLWPSMDVLPAEERQMQGIALELSPITLPPSGQPQPAH